MDKQSHHRALLALLVVVATALVFAPGADAAPCGTPGNNEIVEENCKPGTSQSQWDVSGAGDASIQGFATDISVAQGGTVQFKVDTTAPSYRLDIYRMGYYGGAGARFITTVNPTAVRDEDNCPEQAATGLIDCSGWAVSASWNVPATAVSGIYFAKLVSATGSSHVPFIVRDDDGASNVLFQTSDTTWQAYNTYGGNSLYQGSPDNRAYKVSYNRPFVTRGNAAEDWLFNAEYPMVRWLERNGYDVSYSTGVDTDRRGAELLEHQVFLSVGHDEYWSGAQRANVEIARNAGVSLAFLSGNEVFWKTRLENGNRTLVAYKETHANAEIDSDPVWTGTWRDPRPFNAEGPRPENALTGTSFSVNSGSRALSVPAEDGRLRLWRNSPVGSQLLGTTATLTDGTVGYEWDEDLDNGSRPAGLVRLSSTSASGVEKLQDYGSNYALGTATHHLTLYRDTNGAGLEDDALVFGGGTVQWSWGLDSNHDRGNDAADPSMQQATINLLADMGVQPTTRQPELDAASASTDTTAPTPLITAPAAGTTLQQRVPTTIQGTAADAGRVGAVEVSVDNGVTWHPATGRETWSYTWTPATPGPVTIRARAADDSANLSGASAGTAVTVGGRSCPCTLFGGTAPTGVTANDGSPIEAGVKFRSDEPGTITGLRYYKGTGWLGTRVGHLWREDGTRLAEAQFTGESATGWQQVILAAPVHVDANTTYVASFLSSDGSYVANPDFFTSAFDAAPLHAPSGDNGVFVYNGGFPNLTSRDANYWADVVFTPDDDSPPAVVAVTPSDGSTGVAPGTQVTATFDEPLKPSSVNATTFRLRSGAGTVPATIVYSGPTRTATLTPAAPLAAGGAYTAILSGVQDAIGNPLAQDVNWSFTVAPASTPDPGPPVGGEPSDLPSRPGSPGGTGGGATPPAGPGGGDQSAPRVIVGPRTARVSRNGTLKLSVSCPSGEQRCRVTLRLRHAGHDAAERTVTLRGGKTRRFSLELSQRARRALVRKGSIRIKAISVARDAAGNQRTTRTTIQLTPRA